MSEQALPPQMQMMQMISGFWVSRCIFVATKLNLSDHLIQSPQSVSVLAEKTNSHPDSLYRMLRLLASVGIFTETDPQVFANTPLSETLSENSPHSIKYFALAELGADHFMGWGNLLHSVQTGDIAFDHINGADIWAYYAQNPEDGQNFMRAMTNMSENFNPAIVPAYPFGQYRKIVDIGGGNGSLLCSILKANPESQGIVFDEAYVIEKSNEFIQSQGLSERCQTQAGSFFDAVPSDGDLYLMKFIIHDWNDDKALQILKACHQGMAPGTPLLLVELMIPEGNEPDMGKFIDVNMLVMTGGKERTESEHQALLSQAGFELKQVHHTPSPLKIIEAIRQ